MVAPFTGKLNNFNRCSMAFAQIKPAKINLSLFGRLGEERVAVGVGCLDGGKCCSQCSLATDDCDLGRTVFGQRAGQLVEAVLADGIVAHSDRAHSNLLSSDKVLSGILLLEKVHSREKFRTYKTSVEGFSSARNVLAYSA